MSLIGEQLKKKADQMSKAVTLESNHGPATAGDQQSSSDDITLMNSSGEMQNQERLQTMPNGKNKKDEVLIKSSSSSEDNDEVVSRTSNIVKNNAEPTGKSTKREKDKSGSN